MDSKTVVVFDTPGKDGEVWSHHTLRILFSLHYKGISYTIEGVDYPDIVSTFEPTSLQPKDDPVEPYEIPVVKLQNAAGAAQYRMLTPEIVQALEDLNPVPSLLYSSPRSVEFRSRFGSALAPILQLAVGHVPNILSPRSAEFFRQKREARWGKSFDEWIAEHPIEKGLGLAEPRLRELGEWIEQTPGPFIDGDQLGYADLTIASVLGYVKALPGLADAFDQLLLMSPAVEKLYYAVGLSQQGNSHSLSLWKIE